MKLSENTRNILDNLSSINPSIIFRPGNIIWSGDSEKPTIFCRANVEETFDKQVGIYNLKKFLGVLSLFEGEPDLTFEDDSHVVISNGKQKIKYVLADQSLIKTSPAKNPNAPEPVESFGLTANDLSTTLKASSVLGLPNIEFVGNGTDVQIVARDPKNSSKDDYSVTIGKTDKTFSVSIPKVSFKLMNVDYTVYVHPDYVKLESPAVTYWLARQA